MSNSFDGHLNKTLDDLPELGGRHGERPRDAEYDYINPQHYKSFSVETIDMMVGIYGSYITAYYCELNAFKYRMRLGNKPNQPIGRDLEKARWYENKARELRADDLPGSAEI